MMNIEILRQTAQEKSSRIIELRRQIHQYPELAYQEVRTAQLIQKELQQLGVEVHSNYAETTAVIGVIHGEQSGPTRALRADMDALSVQENTGLPFASKIPGKMHACGHDAHVAILLGAAHLLNQLHHELSGKIVLVFQPAEEGGGGGRKLVEYGLLEEFGIQAMFGHHVWSNLPEGCAYATRQGVLTSNSDAVFVEIVGKGAHGARPNMGIDPVIIASHYVLACQELISREIAPYDPAVITFGKLQAGDTYNVISEKAKLEGTVRTQTFTTQDFLEKRLAEVLTGITSAFRTTGTFKYVRNYPSVVNDPQLTAQVMIWAEEFWGKEQIATVSQPSMVGEDFAFYARKIPACLGLLNSGSNEDLHNPRFTINEGILASAAAWTTYVAVRSTEFLENLH
ncbi:amidohydrolase [Candidatus Vecturithrix granuli]|uniref:Amidohydrolase n=1 Tax=Vecturithrix granuli TaxID=1499967 RepID=A0A081BUW7_VECG1|nr:amidohydrolase [Candidatus Vecturithrix granuli]